MKKPHELFGFRVKARKVCAFVEIAMVTGEREVFRRVFAAVLTRNATTMRAVFIPKLRLTGSSI